jgi:hypothetical protein
MSRLRAHVVSIAGVICAVSLLVPVSAGAHQPDCTGSYVLTPAPSADLFSDWTGEDRGCVIPASAADTAAAAPSGEQVVTASAKPAGGSFTQVGHNPLMRRGMNAAIAVSGDYAYIGSRTDLHPGTPTGGVMVVDISDPSAPRLLGKPFDAHAG